MGSPPQGYVVPIWSQYSYAGSPSSNTTTSLTFVSTGNGVSVNSGPKGQIHAHALAFLFQSNAADGIEWGLYHNTTGIPANGVSVGSDTLHFSDAQQTVPAANTPYPYQFLKLITGLAVNATVFVYQGYRALTAGTVTQDGGFTECWPVF